MTTPHYPTVNPNPDFAALEEEVLQLWKESGAFQKSIDQRPARNADGSSNAYVFYDGPPFANGLPHYGHLLTGYVKDAIARYHTMKGKRVERRFGWDCHGLPAEMGAEKELQLSGRAAIMEYGIGKFNDYCRSSVMRYVHDWEYYVTRQGRWVDFKNDYKTMDTDFMESVLWAFKQLFDKGLIYESFRVMPYSWAAETPVSNFETRIDNATREREDKAATVLFTLREADTDFDRDEQGFRYQILAWTTTPWTLPSNLALAVNGTLPYAVVEIEAQKTGYILLASELAKYGDKIGLNPGDIKSATELFALSDVDSILRLHDGAVVIKQCLGSELVGLSYEPLFPYFTNTPNAFRIIDGGEAVTEGEGTGVIHMAPGFGEIDQKVCAANGIEVVVPVDGQGRYTDEIYDLPDLKLQGLNVIADKRLEEGDRAQHIAEKDVEKFGLANMRIVRWLKAHGQLVKDEAYKHNYPHCWRTDTPLIYRAMSSWYVRVTAFKDRMASVNKTIDWTPDHVRDGAMGHMLETAPDWSISRNRFWGCPIPVWRSDNPNSSEPLKVFGSIEELQAFFGVEVIDLHRPFIDELTAPDPSGGTYRRVEDVLDCWFESGSMPYAQLHYPFENKELFEETFPADFITEYIAQTRGWFNTLITLSTALSDKAPFRHVICHGVVIDEETGLKYSKRLKNYKDPKEVMDAFGADALRWLMLASPVMRGANLGVDPEGKFIRDVVRLNIKPLWSAYNFFTLYANADGVKAKEVTESENLLDRYILAKAKAAVSQVQASMDAYDTPGATDAITGFFDVLNNWYIRRSRARFWTEEISADKQAAYDTLYTVITLLCRAAAPLLPFTAEMVYRGLVGAEHSVHLTDFPDVAAIDSAAALVADMDRVRDACTAMGAIRSAENIRNRQPLASATLYGSGADRLKPFAALMEDEINVKEIRFSNTLEGVAEFSLTIDFKVAGKRLGGKMKAVGAAAKTGDWKREGETIFVGGEAMEEGEYNLQLKPLITKGAQRLSSNDAMVVLDLAITPELEAEGRARDLVRMIQQARKDAGLNVADRIALALDIPAEFGAAMATHKDYIAEQTLAVSIGEGSASAEQKITQELDGVPFVIGISKAA